MYLIFHDVVCIYTPLPKSVCHQFTIKSHLIKTIYKYELYHLNLWRIRFQMKYHATQYGSAWLHRKFVNKGDQKCKITPFWPNVLVSTSCSFCTIDLWVSIMQYQYHLMWPLFKVTCETDGERWQTVS